MTVTTLNNRGGRKKAGSSFAPLSNMLRVEEAMLRSIGRPGHLPGLIGIHGPAGYGKTWSAAYIAAQYDAVYIELADYHSQTAFLDCFLERLGLPATGRTIGAKAEKAVRHLIEHPRPVIIDEVDVAIRKSYLELLRAIADKTQCPMMLVGEQHLPQVLEQWDRVANRMLAYVEMQPCTLDDALTLRNFYEEEVAIADDLAAHFQKTEKGVARRIVIQLEHARQKALETGADSIDLSVWTSGVGEGGAPWRGKTIGAP